MLQPISIHAAVDIACNNPLVTERALDCRKLWRKHFKQRGVSTDLYSSYHWREDSQSAKRSTLCDKLYYAHLQLANVKTPLYSIHLSLCCDVGVDSNGRYIHTPTKIPCDHVNEIRVNAL